VQWYVAANTATISVETHAKLEALWAGNLAFAGGRGNNRKVQDTNNRTITFFSL
jgi:carbonic anhydrase